MTSYKIKIFSGVRLSGKSLGFVNRKKKQLLDRKMSRPAAFSIEAVFFSCSIHHILLLLSV